jgi:serine protease Do
MKKLFLFLFAFVILIVLFQKFNFLSNPLYPAKSERRSGANQTIEKQTVVYEESVITKVVEEALPSVVTVGISTTTSTGDVFQINPFNPFLPFERIPGKTQKVEKNIGSGFIISADGLIITNKHVVSNTQASYQVLTNDKKKYNVEKIYRDPLNDLSILKISLTSPNSLKPLKLGNSSKLKLGQLVIAIGTPLGEFTNTVTSGIISGLGRGITAGSPFEGYVEKLDNVIQTDAAISMGNSGGPLLNSKGEVIGVNAAIAQEGQNIGFAIPVNVVSDLINNFQKNGSSFEHAYIGVRYKLIDKQTAVLNELIEGVYIVQVIQGSPAEKAGIQEEDIIIEFDGKKINGSDEQTLTKFIAEKKPGERVTLKIWRNKEIKNISVTLESAK